MPECLVANLFQPPLILECLVHDFIKIQTLFCLKQILLHLEDSLVALSTSQTLVQISLLLFKLSANMFYTLHQLTSKLLLASYDISKMLLVFPYFLLPVKFNWRHSVTLIGWVTSTPQVHNYFLCLFRLFSYSLEIQKAATVSKSSYEAKYHALTSVACELQWLTYLLIYVYLPSKSYFFCDNHSTLHIVANPVFHERTKHMKIDCHIVRERLLSGSIKLLPIFPANQFADIFTKALSPSAFRLLQLKLEMSNIHSSA